VRGIKPLEHPKRRCHRRGTSPRRDEVADHSGVFFSFIQAHVIRVWLGGCLARGVRRDARQKNDIKRRLDTNIAISSIVSHLMILVSLV